MNPNSTTLGLGCLLTIALSFTPARSQTSAAMSPGPGDHQCDIQLVLGTPGINHPPVPPAGRIRIMPTRYGELEKTLVGYQTTHVPLVKYDGRVFGPAGATDDLGSYYFVPQLAILLRLPLRRSIDVFYIAVLVAALALGILGCSMALRTNMAKMWATASLILVAALAYGLGDVYILLAAVVMAIVPLALYVSETSRLSIAALFIFASGLAISTANAIRGHSGTGVLLFLLCLVPTRFLQSIHKKISLVLVLVCGLLVPNLYFAHLVKNRDNFLRSVCPDYPHFSTTHPLWHQVYIGLGYLTNDVVPSYRDHVAYDKVQSIAPGTLFASADYEKLLRKQVLLIVQEKPQFVLYTLAAKLGVICLLFLVFANVGLIGAIRARKPAVLELAFWLGIGFNALFGIVVVPVLTYLLGFITFAALYGVVSLDCAIQHNWKRSARGLGRGQSAPACTYSPPRSTAAIL